MRETNSSLHSNAITAERFRALLSAARRQVIGELSERDANALLYDWEFWARPTQLAPPGDWINWLILAGRGYGKTRVGAEQVRRWTKEFPIVNLIGPTAADVRDIMVQGINAGSAIMEVCPKDELPVYEKSNRRLVWPNGAVSFLFSAEEPERLRGPQHMKLWCDEIAAWRNPEACWEQAEFGLRLGAKPQTVITTTPKPTRLIKMLANSESTHLTQGTTYENRSNLTPAFLKTIIAKYEGTRLGRQELNAEILEDRPGALWTLRGIDVDRVLQPPALRRIVVGVDPAVTSGEESDEWGIVCVGEGVSLSGEDWPPHYYVLDDLSSRFTPNEAARQIVHAYKANQADRIVAEVNNGGDLVEAILRNVDHSFAYKAVHASRGKQVRAEPIAALYEQHRVHHVGTFGALEDQMCDYVPAGSKSPDRMDALVWALSELTSDEEHEIFFDDFDTHSISPDLDRVDNWLPRF